MTAVFIPIEPSTLEMILALKPNPDSTYDQIIAGIVAKEFGMRRVPIPKPVPSQNPPAPHRGPLADLLGERITSRTKKDLYLKILIRLQQLDCSFFEKLAKCCAYSRRYAAREPQQLYPGRPRLALKNSTQIDGWWVGTNYGERDFSRILKAACESVGLKYGRDLIVKW